jgi:ribosome-associated toxin RatA of RatAB toxin-antitoxin module
MFRVQRSVTINEEIDKVWQIANDLENWPKIFPPCEDLKILKKDGNKTVFEITVRPIGKLLLRWRTSRVVDDTTKSTKSVREYPKFPFREVIIEWIFEEITENNKKATKVTFVNSFSMAIPIIGWLFGKLLVRRIIGNIIKMEQETLKRKIEAGFIV